MSYKNTFEKHLNMFLTEKKLTQKVVVDYSSYEDYQYQSPIGLVLSKQIKGFNPEEIKEYLLNNFPNDYNKITISGPGFISVKFNLIEQENKLESKKKVIVDYCGVNVAKQMHIGHIRSMFIGDYIVRTHESIGDEVIIYNHIGDWGNQFGFLINYIQSNKLENEISNKKLTEYYKLAYAKNESDEDFSVQSAKIAYNLQNKLDFKIVSLWESLVNVSMVEAEKVFNEFNLKMNLSHTKGESFYAQFCQGVLEDLINKKIATKNEDGSVVVFFENKSPLMLQKSNGNYLYALYDIAAIKWRIENDNPDKIIYVVDNRQSLHFEQVFNIINNADYNNKAELLHVAFGTILGKDKKPLKTKSGESLYLDDLFAQGKEILLNNEKFIEMPLEIKEEILNKTIVGGLKFYDLKFNKTQDYIFDWDNVLNFIGGSAPYIQNAMVRIDSIYVKLNKDITNIEKIDWDFNWEENEKEILFNLQKADELINTSNKNYNSQLITEQSIKICQLLHKYYEGEKIIGSEKEDKKLSLLGNVYNKLNELCNVLGIENYRCMTKLISQKKNKI